MKASWAMAAALMIAAHAAAAADLAWRHGIPEAGSDAGITMMVNRGFAQKQGVKLDLVPFKNDTAALRALIAGDIDSYDGSLTDAVAAAARDIDIRLLGCDWPGLPEDVFVRPAIATPTDLRGKTVAVSTPHSLPELLAKAVLAKSGVPAGSVTFINRGSDLERYKALVAGAADASVVSGEYAPLAVKDGVRLLVAGRDVLPDYMRLCIFSTGAALRRHPEAAVHFMAAEMQGLAYAINHRDETIALTRAITGMKPDDPRPAYLYDDAVASHSIDPTLSLPPQKIVWMANELVREGILAQPYDMSHMIDATVRAKALPLAGM